LTQILPEAAIVAAVAEPDPAAYRRPSGSGPVAVVDIGSNSVRLVVYERLARSPTPLFNEKVFAGLGRGIETTGRIADEALARALGAVRRYALLLRQMAVTDTYILATSAARDADNGPGFISAVEEITGLPVHVLSGEDEARLSALGVISAIPEAEGIVGDLGGGSLELVPVKTSGPGRGLSFPLGGLRLEEAAGGSIAKAESIVAATLADAARLTQPGATFYAVGGTWRSLARLHMVESGYPLRVMHGYAIRAAEALEFSRMVARRDVETIDSIDVVSESRRDLLGYGALVLEHVIRVLRPRQIVVSALGVREGHLFERLSPEERALDPLLAAAADLAYLRSRSPLHAFELGPWTGEAFAALGMEETPEEVRLRIASCLLSDIGWRAHPDYRGEQSLNIIAHGAFIGIDHPGRAYLALSSFYRHVGLVDDALSPRIRELVPIRIKERARTLGAALRLAYVISAATHGVITRTRLARQDKRLVLTLPPDLADLAGERLRKRLRQLAKIGGLTGTVEVGPA